MSNLTKLSYFSNPLPSLPPFFCYSSSSSHHIIPELHRFTFSRSHSHCCCLSTCLQLLSPSLSANPVQLPPPATLPGSVSQSRKKPFPHPTPITFTHLSTSPSPKDTTQHCTHKHKKYLAQPNPNLINLLKLL